MAPNRSSTPEAAAGETWVGLPPLRVTAFVGSAVGNLDRGVAVPIPPRKGDRATPKASQVGDPHGYHEIALADSSLPRRHPGPGREADHETYRRGSGVSRGASSLHAATFASRSVGVRHLYPVGDATALVTAWVRAPGQLQQPRGEGRAQDLGRVRVRAARARDRTSAPARPPFRMRHGVLLHGESCQGSSP
jgi:hypothetical protein